ncbi:MAG: L,D-transpeptidase [Candidatus Villigracilaceae bacterium]
MKPLPAHLSRREFLKLAGAGLGALAFSPLTRVAAQFPAAPRLGRVTEARVDIKSMPHPDMPTIGQLAADTVVEWRREVTGMSPTYISRNQRWVETEHGYIFASHLQPVRNLPNIALAEMPAGLPGFWAEVTVPYVDLILDGPAVSPWLKSLIQYNFPPRLYYGQVVWIDRIKTGEDGRIYYRFNEDQGHGYGYGDIFWADGAAFYVLQEEDVAPISPDVDPAEKTIVADLTYQTLSCYEGNREVFFCRISSGAKYAASGAIVDTWATPVGELYTHWKIISLNMSGGSSTAGYSTPAVPWSTVITPEGVAIHGAFWHNDFGTPRSHGCINVRPEDAKWIFRWTTPYVSLQQCEIRMTWPEHGTVVKTTERKL